MAPKPVRMRTLFLLGAFLNVAIWTSLAILVGWLA
jgi:hypothetical protein